MSVICPVGVSKYKRESACAYNWFVFSDVTHCVDHHLCYLVTISNKLFYFLQSLGDISSLNLKNAFFDIKCLKRNKEIPTIYIHLNNANEPNDASSSRNPVMSHWCFEKPFFMMGSIIWGGGGISLFPFYISQTQIFLYNIIFVKRRKGLIHFKGKEKKNLFDNQPIYILLLLMVINDISMIKIII